MATKIPSFSYTGRYSTQLSNGYWYINFLSSGTLTMNYSKKSADVFLCGGGASGAGGDAVGDDGYSGHGGAGGYTTTRTGIPLTGGQAYWIQVGSGGTAGAVDNDTHTAGVASSAFGYSASGGSSYNAGTGVGGKCGMSWYDYGANKVVIHSEPESGGSGVLAFGTGGVYYGGGGGGGASTYNKTIGYGGPSGGGAGGGTGSAGSSGAANTGGGGGGGGPHASGNSGTGGAGGSGIVILRGTEDDMIPVIFNGTQLSDIVYNGTKITSLIYNGTKLFFERLKARWGRCLNSAEPVSA